MSGSDVHELTGVYALDALDPDEAMMFEAHLRSCEACRSEVRDLQEVAANLALVETAVPPPAIRARLFDAIADPAPPSPLGPPAPIRPPANGRGRLPWFAAAAAAVVVSALFAGIVLAFARPDAPTEEAGRTVTREAAAATAVLTDPDAETIPLEGPAGARGEVRWSARAARGLLRVSELPAPGPGQVYELWYIDDAARAGPLFDASTEGVVLTGQGPQPPKSFAVTIEPAGGVDRATGPVVLSGGARR